MMRRYRVNVTREDKWWMIEVPELMGHIGPDGATNLSTITQARRLSEVAGQARDFICTVTDVAPSEVKLNITVSVDGIDVTARAEKVAADREAADRHAAAAAVEAKQLARELAEHGVPMRDVGEVLGVSFQRAQQLISA